MSAKAEKRRGIRVATRFEALSTQSDPCDSSAPVDKQGVAMLADISYTGARLNRTALSPELGAFVKVQIFLPSHTGVYFELEGQVVRRTQNGFAIEYDWPGQEICRLVDDAASLL